MVAKGSLNHVEIYLTQTHVEVWASDASPDGVTFPNFQRLYAGDLDLPFGRGYVSLIARNHATIKYGGGLAWIQRWDNVGFDGPVVGGWREASVPDALEPTSDGEGPAHRLHRARRRERRVGERADSGRQPGGRDVGAAGAVGAVPVVRVERRESPADLLQPALPPQRRRLARSLRERHRGERVPELLRRQRRGWAPVCSARSSSWTSPSCAKAATRWSWRAPTSGPGRTGSASSGST